MLFPHSCLMKAGYLIQKGYYIDSNDFYCLRKNMILSIPIWFAIALAIDMLESTRPI